MPGWLPEQPRVLGSLYLLMQCSSSFSDICTLCTIEAVCPRLTHKDWLHTLTPRDDKGAFSPLGLDRSQSGLKGWGCEVTWRQNWIKKKNHLFLCVVSSKCWTALNCTFWGPMWNLYFWLKDKYISFAYFSNPNSGPVLGCSLPPPWLLINLLVFEQGVMVPPWLWCPDRTDLSSSDHQAEQKASC